MSPSIRREWIEMVAGVAAGTIPMCLPPYGGSGLKFDARFWDDDGRASPSIRREWIEISADIRRNYAG